MSEVRERTTRELADVLLTVRPDRARRCTGCQVTHVVSTPACCRAAPTVPPRSARCWSQPPAGAGTGSSPTGLPSRTAVRGWIRRARASARRLWAMGVQAVVTLDPDALPAQFRPDPLASALGVLGAAAMALGDRFALPHASPRARVTVLTRGQLLSPSPAPACPLTGHTADSRGPVRVVRRFAAFHPRHRADVTDTAPTKPPDSPESASAS